jgi:DNA polymerase-1
LPLDRAIHTFDGPIQRAFGHKALNRRLQGSAADLLKAAMVICWESGIFAETGVPRITVHDELGFSDPGGLDAPFKAMHNVMENAIKLNVPVRCDFKAGPNWGACE